MISRIIKDLLNGCELTVCDNNICIMNKYKLKSYEIKYDIFNCLKNSFAIIADSGNFETNERHYVLNYDGVSQCNFDNKLQNIMFLIVRINNNLLYGEELISELKILKLREERKQKLKRIKQIC